MNKSKEISNSTQIVRLSVLALFLILLPFFLSTYWQDVLILFVINVILVLSFRLITTMGEWSFAHIVIMGLGAYTVALMTTRFFNFSFWIVLPMGGFVSALFALAISYPVLRTKNFYFFLSTFAAGEALRQCFIQFVSVFGGIEGVSFIERPDAILGFDFTDIIHFYYLALALASISILIFRQIEKCRIGRTIKAISANDTLTESFGIHTWGYKAMTFVIGSFFAGIAGGLFASYNGFVAPTDYSTIFMYRILTAAIIGGTRTMVGPILGLLLVTMVQELFRDLRQWVPFIFGACIIGILLFSPGGIESQLGSFQLFFKRMLSWLRKGRRTRN